MTEKDYIGLDPVRWIERLRDVNAESQFPSGAKQIIEDHFAELLLQLKALYG